MKTIRQILIIFIFVCKTFVFSQNYVDLLKVNVNTTPYNSFDTSSAQTKVNEIMVDFTVPIKLNEKTSIITGAIYESIQTKLFEDGDIKTFGSTTLKLGLNNKFNEKWSGTLIALPKIASDYKSIGNKDFQLGAIGILKLKKNDNLNYKVGLYYNAELFGPFFVPMLGFYYLSPNKKFEANLMLPLQSDVNYKLKPFMSVGINYNGLIRSYHLNDGNGSYVSKFSNELSFYLKFDITKKMSLQTKFGQSIGRKYKVFDENDKVDFGLSIALIGGHRKQLNTNFSDGLIFQISFFYRFSLEKK